MRCRSTSVRQWALTPSYVRRVLNALRGLELIQEVGELNLFLAHPLMGAASPSPDGTALDVQGLWANDSFFIPRTIASVPSQDLSSAEKLFFAVLRRCEEKRWHHKVTAKQQTLGNELGIGTREVQKLVAALEAKGLVDVQDRRRYGRTNVMRTHVRTPWVGRTRAAARSDNQQARAQRWDL